MKKSYKIAITGAGIAISGAAVFILLRKITGNKIVRIAKTFVGQRETGNNQGFVSANFEKLMRTLGKWYSGAEWCASFARLVWMLALSGKKRIIADKLMNPSTQQTYDNFSRDTSGLFRVSQKPKTGSVVIWRSRSRPHKGHAGIYIGKMAGKHFFIEGNAKDAVRLMNYVDYKNISNDLYLRGFINW